MKSKKILKLIGGLGTGIGIGTCFGVAMGNMLAGIGIGLGVGLCYAVAYGAFRDDKE